MTPGTAMLISGGGFLLVSFYIAFKLNVSKQNREKVERAVAAERERCARVAENHVLIGDCTSYSRCAMDIAGEIREGPQ